jgi:outer membrane immunogenic protein
MKRALTLSIGIVTLAALPALAADLPPRYPTKAPVMVASVYNWSGCYIGVEGGAAWGRARDTSLDPRFPGDITNSFSLSGVLVGGTLGCNYQVDRVVFGIEGDLSWTNKRGNSFAVPPFLTSSLIDVRESWIGTVRGRLGYAFADRWLLYVTGGLAATTARLNVSDAVFGINASESQNRVGWTIGGGVEAALDRNWTAKVEYLYVDYGRIGYFSPSVTIGPYTLLNQSVSLTDHLFRVGVNYRFGYDTVVARY